MMNAFNKLNFKRQIRAIKFRLTMVLKKARFTFKTIMLKPISATLATELSADYLKAYKPKMPFITTYTGGERMHRFAVVSISLSRTVHTV